MKVLLILTIIFWIASSATAQGGLNENCTITAELTHALRQALFRVFDKSSKIRLMEYVLAFDNYTNKQTYEDSAFPFKNWKWFHTQEFGSCYFFFLDEYFWTFRFIYGNIKASVEINFKVNPPNCLGELPIEEQQVKIRNVLVSDLDFKQELQKLNIEISPSVEICLNDNQYDVLHMFKHYRCCGFNKWNQYYCNDHEVLYKILYFFAPFVISVILTVLIFFMLSYSYTSFTFDCYEEADTEITNQGKVKLRKDRKPHGSETLSASKFMTTESSNWLVFGFYYHKLRYYTTGYSGDHIAMYKSFQKSTSNSDRCCYGCCKCFCFPDENKPSLFTLIVEFIVLTTPFVILFSERINAEDVNLAVILCAIISIINLLLLAVFCIKNDINCSIHRFEIKDNNTNNFDCKRLHFLFYKAVVIFFSILSYVKFVFMLIAYIFFEFEKSDIYISLISVLLLYILTTLKKENLKLKHCLREFECALNEIMINNRNEQDRPMHLEFQFISEKCQKDRRTYPIFFDNDGNFLVWKELFYSFCQQYYSSSSCFKILVKAAVVTILLSYLVILLLLVTYFDGFYDYSVVKKAIIVIGGGYLPVIIRKGYNILWEDRESKNNDDGFLKFLRDEIKKHGEESNNTDGLENHEASSSNEIQVEPEKVGRLNDAFEMKERKEKMASKDVLLFVGRTGNGKTSSIRSIRSVLKDGTTAPDPPKTAPGTSTIQPDLEIATETKDNLELIDGTGIGDNEDYMIVHAKGLVKSVLRNATNGFTALVFVVKYGEEFTKQEVEAVEAVKAVKSIFGNDVFKKWGIILMTYGDNVYHDHEDDPGSFITWCRAQSGDFKKLFDECNERCVLFNNKTNKPSVLERQHKMLMKQVEAVRMYVNGPYTYANFDLAQRSRHIWVMKNKGKAPYNP